MRRFLAVLTLAALCVRAAPASGGDAAEGPPDSLRIRVDRESLVQLDQRRVRELLPSLREEVPHVWGMPRKGFSLPTQVHVTIDSGFRFVAHADWTYEIRLPGRPPMAAGTAGVPEPGLEPVFDNDATVVEYFRSSATHSTFGPVAAAAPAVYAGLVPHWYIGKIDARGHAEVPLAIPRGTAADGTKITVNITVVGTHDGPVRLGARWGARDIGEQGASSAAGGAALEFQVLAKDVEGAERLWIEDRSPPPSQPDPRDVSEGRGTVWIDDVHAEVLAKPHQGPLLGSQAASGSWHLDQVDGTSLLVPHRDPPDPVAAARDVDVLLLSTAALLPAARRLGQHREAGGLRAAVVPIAEVFGNLAWSGAGAEAVAMYMARLGESGTRPRFVLLCGDATFDRSDLVRGLETIPTGYAHTKYNGATASDRYLLSRDERKVTGGPAIGRLPFRDAKTMDAYVDRVIAYETKPPADPSRRRLDFVTSEGRFGPLIDTMTERLFTGIVAHAIPPAYDVEVTFASASSPFLWAPPEFNDKVIRDLDAGALTFTYVGHGWWDGFDDLRYGGKRFPILRDKDATQVDVKGTPPAMFVIACTTARFDDPDTTSVGERLLAQPHGPIAYWGATRICHPAWNAVVGRQIAMGLFASKDARVGEILRDAADRAVAGDPADKQQQTIRSLTALMAPGEDMDRLYREGSLMYNLLGDPAVKLALPDDDLRVEAKATATGFSVRAAGDGLEDGAEVHLSVEVARDVMLDLPPAAGPNTTEAERLAAIRARHDKANDKALSRADARAQGGSASADFAVPEARRVGALFVKAWTVSGGRVRQGAIELPAK